jgi:hypothetical protein
MSRFSRQSRMRQKISVLAFFALGLIGISPAIADIASYDEIVDLRADSSQLTVEHHHDWSKSTSDARWKMISGDRNPFTPENTYASLKVVEKETGKTLFTAPVPALTYLWISADSRFIVGLSNIKIRNPYQLVVFDRAGHRLFQSDLMSLRTRLHWPAVSETVTNWVNWYMEPVPRISLLDNKGTLVLSIEDKAGDMHDFSFPTQPGKP